MIIVESRYNNHYECVKIRVQVVNSQSRQSVIITFRWRLITVWTGETGVEFQQSELGIGQSERIPADTEAGVSVGRRHRGALLVNTAEESENPRRKHGIPTLTGVAPAPESVE